MPYTRIGCFMVQELIAILLILVGWMGGMAWWSIVPIVLIAMECASATRRQISSPRSIHVLWGLSVYAVISMLWPRRSIYVVEQSHAWVATLLACALWIASSVLQDSNKKRGWKELGFVWAFLATVFFLVAFYSKNKRVAFHIVLGVAFVLLVMLKKQFTLNTVGIQVVNTLLLLVVALPAVDYLIRPRYELDVQPDTRKRFYSYEAALRDPVAFRHWWRYFRGQWELLAKELYVKDPQGVLPFRLAPGKSARIFQSLISINPRGFRGEKVAASKGDNFRIVALGESTTFGCTLNPEDRTWPDWLDEMIREELNPPCPVEVINAGIPSFTIKNNVSRLERDILPLNPDLVISYHGYNGFYLLDPAIAPPLHRRPPRYRERPIKLLADVEYRLRVIAYEREHFAGGLSSAPARDPSETPYALHYEKLIEAMRTNGIALAIANFSMAVNPRSDERVIEFYRAGFPQTFRALDANVLHSRLVEQLARDHPEIQFVDTHPGLDGYHEHFIDLVHFTESGRRQLASNIFRGIRPLLKRMFTNRVGSPLKK